jgi:hypothetical protein
MLLAPESQRRLEKFFRHHLRDESLRLPRVKFYAGRFTGLLTKTFRIGAITFGSRVFVAPRLICRGANSRLTLPAKLAVHEATHVLQYRRVGVVPFLFLYLRDYARALSREAGRAGARHRAAYLAISFEVEARAAAESYDAWRGRGDVNCRG